MSTSFDLILANGQAYVNSILGGALGKIQEALGVLGNLSDGHEQNIPTINIQTPETFDPGDGPVYSGSHYFRRELTATAPTLLNMPSLVFRAAPAHRDQVIEYNDPIRPSARPDRSPLGSVPDVGVDIDIPEAPDLLGEVRTIIAPTITPITIPDAPPYRDPDFRGQRPTIRQSAPTNLDETFRTAFDSSASSMRAINQSELEAFLNRDFPGFRAGLASLETKISEFMAGGTALTTSVQDAIYTRLLDKTHAESRRSKDSAIAEFARAGQVLVGPIIARQIQVIDQSGRDNDARGAADLAIKISELEMQHLQFAMTASAQLRQVAMSAALQYYSGVIQTHGEAINYAKGVVQAVVDAYGIAARIAEAEARLYEADARVYEARQRGAIAVIDGYKATVQGLEAQANVNRAQVDAYKARIDGVQAEANIYTSIVQALTARAQIRRLQVDIFQAKINGFVAETNGYTAEWEGYAAASRGEAARIDALKVVEQSFLAQVQAFEAEVRAKSVEIEAVAKSNQAATAAYQSQIEAFKALVMAEGEAVKAEVESFSEQLKAYVAKCQAFAEKSKANIAAYSAGHQAMIETAKLFYQNLIEKAKIHESRVEAAGKILQAGAGIYAEVAKSALSGMTTLAADTTSRSE